MGFENLVLESLLPNHPLQGFESGRFPIFVHQSIECGFDCIDGRRRSGSAERLGIRLAAGFLENQSASVRNRREVRVFQEEFPHVLANIREHDIVDKGNTGGRAFDIQKHGTGGNIDQGWITD